MKFDRHRRLRSSKTMRDLVRETHVSCLLYTSDAADDMPYV